MTTFTIPLPTYQCHKRVQALKISHVVPSVRGYTLGFEDQRFCPIEVGFDWYRKHAPSDRALLPDGALSGGYAVWYDDGYMSWSPAAAFEAGYTLVETADGAVRSRDWSAFAYEWPGGPAEVDAALASRDADIERLRTALENAKSAQLAGLHVDLHEVTEVLAVGAIPQQSAAAADVLTERRRQVEAEGWTPGHDDQHAGGAMAAAAGCYALYADAYPNAGEPPAAWPWDPSWWKPKDYRRDLVRSAALLIAEIERLDRVRPAGPATQAALEVATAPDGGPVFRDRKMQVIKPGDTLIWEERGTTHAGKVETDPRWNGGMKVSGKSIPHLIDVADWMEVKA